MLILPPAHGDTLDARRRLSTREKRLLAGVLGVVAALATLLVVSLVVPGPSSSHGCIYATIPAATGAQQINQCGDAARSTCKSVHAPGAYTAQAARAIAGECRKAGLAVGSG